MTPPIEIPEWHLQLIVAHAYSINQSAADAYSSLRAAYTLLSTQDLEAFSDFKSEDFKLYSASDDQAGRPPNIVQKTEKATTDADDDDSGIDEPLEVEDVQNAQISLNTIRKLYTMFAEKELFEMQYRSEPLSLQDLYRILTIRSIAYERISLRLEVPINYLKVTIGKRRIKFVMYHTYQPDRKMTIRYHRTEYGCDVEWNNQPKRPTNIKFQSLAAKDFFYLVQDSNIVFDTLEILIENYHRYQPGVYPFTSFFWKIEKYLRNLQHSVKVKQFTMNFFERPNHRTSNQSIVMTVLPFLDPNILEYLEFRVWKNGDEVVNVNLNTISETEQWEKCRKLDIYDSRIQIEDFDQLLGFSSISVIFPSVDRYDEILQTMANYEPPGSLPDRVIPWFCSITTKRFNTDALFGKFHKFRNKGEIPRDIHMTCSNHREHFDKMVIRLKREFDMFPN